MDPIDDVLGWQRLDPRILLVHPVRDIIRFLPAVIGLLLFGQSSDGNWWGLIAVGVPVALGTLRYLRPATGSPPPGSRCGTGS